MKTLKIFTSIFVASAFIALSPVKAQQKDSTKIQKKIEAKNYRFIAQSATPQRGGYRNLTSSYDLTVKEKSIVAYLPFYGRAYTAPINSTDGGIKFTSKDFEYTSKQIKNGWEISIKPKDADGVSQLFLTVFDNGSASLQVQNINRDAISFDGYIN